MFSHPSPRIALFALEIGSATARAHGEPRPTFSEWAVGQQAIAQQVQASCTGQVHDSPGRPKARWSSLERPPSSNPKPLAEPGRRPLRRPDASHRKARLPAGAFQGRRPLVRRTERRAHLRFDLEIGGRFRGPLTAIGWA
ncbi:MAG: hypothetical protein M2R45_03603 [Verrucomicrobia subdivision 3 bacterium]|nr:hypothetical protein [Limisphaerales bacterium]MCS1416902.1 hypothetical protein [Limisphaerales bacterium]